MSRSISKDLLKPRKCNSDLGFEATYLYRDNKKLEGKAIDIILLIKKLKHVKKL